MTITDVTNIKHLGRNYPFQPETMETFEKLPAGAVSQQAHSRGMSYLEPLIIGFDGMIRYAKAHEFQYGSKLSEDYILGPEFMDVVKGLHGLLNGNGAFANERGLSTDSKDNGACEELFWKALEVAGFTEADL